MNKYKLKQILLLLLVMLPGIKMWGESNDNIKTIVIDASKIEGLSSSNAVRTWKDGEFLGTCRVYQTDDYMDFSASNKAYAYVYNTKAIPGRIKSVTMTKGTGNDSKWTVYVDKKQLTDVTTKTSDMIVGKPETVELYGTTWTVDEKNNSHYFYLSKEINSNVSRISSIVIEYEAAVTTPTIDAGDCASFSSPLMLDLSKLEGIEAYIATGCNSEKVTMEKVTTTIPENTGVVLKSTSNEAKAFMIPTAATANELNNNLLIATTVETVVEKAGNGTNWVLAGSGNSLGWYYIDNFTATLAAGKCYMHTEGTNPAKSSIEMSFEDNATSMDIVNYGANESCAVYNLAGQRVDNNAKGLVIINGKKVYKK